MYKLQYFSKLGLGQYQIKIKVGLLFFNSPKPTRVGYIKHIELTWTGYAGYRAHNSLLCKHVSVSKQHFECWKENSRFRPNMNGTNARNCFPMFKMNNQIEKNQLEKELSWYIAPM